MARAIRDTQIVAVKVPSITGTILAIPDPELATPNTPLRLRSGTQSSIVNRQSPPSAALRDPIVNRNPSAALRDRIVNPQSSIVNPQSSIPKTFYFSDSILTARITFEQFMEIMSAPPPQLDYEVHPRAMNLPAVVDATLILPIQREPYPLAWWQIALMTVGAITILYLIIRIPVKILP